MKHQVKTVLTADLHNKLRRLSVDLGLPMRQLIRDAIVLLLRYHDQGQGLVPPEPPTEQNATKGGTR